MTSKPTFIIVHGAWHTPLPYHVLGIRLEAQGFKVKIPALPSVILEGGEVSKSFESDAEVIAQAIRETVETGGDVVLVMHSYGGVPGSEAMKSFLEPRVGKGKVNRMIWVCSFVVPAGISFSKILGEKPPPWHIMDLEARTVVPENPKDMFYNDLPDVDASFWTKQLRPHSIFSTDTILSVNPITVVPSAYIICEDDRSMPAFVQEQMIAGGKELAPKAFDIVERLKAGHSPFLSQPDKLAEMLIRIGTTERT